MTPDELLRLWQQLHQPLSEDHQRSFLGRREVQLLLAFEDPVIEIAIAQKPKLKYALDHAREQVEDQSARKAIDDAPIASNPAVKRKPQRRNSAEERRLARIKQEQKAWAEDRQREAHKRTANRRFAQSTQPRRTPATAPSKISASEPPAWWTAGEACEKHEFAWCATCKEAEQIGLSTVWVTKGSSSAFHSTPDCSLLADGQRAVLTKGGQLAELTTVPLGLARSQGRSPCRGCFSIG